MKKIGFLALLISMLFAFCKKAEMEMSEELHYDFYSSKITDAKGGLLWTKQDEEFHEYNNLYVNIGISQSDIVGVVFYTQNEFEEIASIDKKKVLALSVYYKFKGKLKHSLFLSESGNFKKVDSFDLYAKSIITDNITYLFNEVSGLADNLCCYYVVMRKKEVLHKSIDELGLKATTAIYKNNTKEVPGASSGDCDSPCNDNGCECEVWNLEEQLWDCEECICQMIVISSDSVTLANYSTNYINTYFDDNLYYTFRDSFMLNYTIGEKYVDYYYTLGSFLESSGEVTPTMMIQTASKMPTLYNVVNNLLYPSSNNTIVVTTETKNHLLSLIDIYDDLSSNTDYQWILEDITNDINLFHNKTYSEIMSML